MIQTFLRRHAKRILLVLFALLLIAIAAPSIRRQISTGQDFPIFYDAANHRGAATGYIYPPLLAFLLRPLALLNLETAAWIWYALTACCFLWLLHLTLPDDYRHSALNAACAALFVTATARLAWLNFELGQVTVVVLLLYALSVRAKEGKGVKGKGVRHLLPVGPEGACAQKVPDPFSFLLGAAVALKMFPLIALPFAWKEKGFLHVVGTAAALAILLGTPLVCGWSFHGFQGLQEMTEATSVNLSLYAQLGWGHYALVLVLLGAGLLAARRGYPHWWVFPALLFMLAPQLLRKAHLISGVLTAGLLWAPVGARRLAWLVPVLWAAGSLATLWLPMTGAGFVLAAYLVLLYDSWTWGKAQAEPSS